MDSSYASSLTGPADEAPSVRTMLPGGIDGPAASTRGGCCAAASPIQSDRACPTAATRSSPGSTTMTLCGVSMKGPSREISIDSGSGMTVCVGASDGAALHVSAAQEETTTPAMRISVLRPAVKYSTLVLSLSKDEPPDARGSTSSPRAMLYRC